MHYYPFHIGDYVARTRHLNLAQDLALRRMLDTYYLHGAMLPRAAKDVAELICMADQLPAVESVLKQFFVQGAEGWSNDRCDRELATMKKLQERARSAGNASARARQAKAATASAEVSWA
jgi:uncharacterized protein YdaU (DUF1376 family)